MMSFLRQLWLPLAIAVVALPLLVLISDQATGSRVALAESYEDSDLELNGRKLKGFALGAEGLLADWYWIRSLQYLGSKIAKKELANVDIEDLLPLNPRLLYPLLDNATDLDPSFMAAYSYGAIVLPAIDRQAAIKFTEKGIANNPEAWRLYHYLGYIYWRQKDYESASRAYDQGGAIVGSPPFMREMAAAMRTRGGSRDTAYELYSQIRDTANDQQSKANAELRLSQINALDDMDAVNKVLAEFRNRNGHCPARIAEIFPLLRNVKMPRERQFLINRSNEITDPTGIAYVLDTKECRIGLNRQLSKIPPPND
jgi:tetratricopeptide (TPR) repeat protein